MQPRRAMERMRERKRRRRDRRDRLLAAGIRGLRRFARALGPRVTITLSAAAARLVGRILPGPRKLALMQLGWALPELDDQQRARVVDRMFDGLGRSLGEMLVLDLISAELDRWVRIEGAELLESALAGGRGVVSISGHIGNWEIMAATLALRGYPLTVVATEVKGRRLNQENVALRASVGVETILRSAPGSARDLLRTLRRGGLLGLLIDQDTRVQSVTVPFFGRPARTPVGAAALALRTDAPVVGIFIHREADGRHLIKILDPQLPPRPLRDGAARPGAATDDADGDDRGPLRASSHREIWQVEATAVMTRLIERQIRNHPESWVWWHRRWGLDDAVPIAAPPDLRP